MICWHMFLQIPNFRKVAAAITNCTFKFFFFYFIFVCYLHIECFKHTFCKFFLNVQITLLDWRSCLSLLLRLEKTFPQNWQGTGARLGVLISELLWDSLAFFFGGDPDQFSVSVKAWFVTILLGLGLPELVLVGEDFVDFVDEVGCLLSTLGSWSWGIIRGFPAFPFNQIFN